ncbi:MAG TPA: hypothetical protein VFF68_07950 [Anaerolineaceae bacterium]|nr:hypothetical protein [Anaerolineaceae bacterium]
MTSELPDSPPEQPQDPASTPAGETSDPDLIDQIRQEMKEEAVQQQARKKTGWLARLTGRLQGEKPAETPTPVVPLVEPELSRPVVPQPAAEEPSADAPLAETPEAEAEFGAPPKSLAFDIEVEEVEWSPPAEQESEDIDDDFFSSRLGQFAAGEDESPPGDGSTATFAVDPEAPRPFTAVPGRTAPFVIEDPVLGDFDFNAPLPALSDDPEPDEQPDAEPAAVPFAFADEEPAGEAAAPAEDEPGGEAAPPEEPAVGEGAAESLQQPARPGFFARIFGRGKAAPDRYSMDDDVVTGRLHMASTADEEERPLRPEPGKPRPAEAAQPPTPALTQPFWDGISTADDEDDHPQTEEEFWESLTRKERDPDTPFRPRSMNWAAFEEEQKPLTGYTAPFHTPDESAAEPEVTFDPGETTPWATGDAIPYRAPYDTGAEADQPPPAGSLAEPDRHAALLPSIEDESVEIGELRSIALEDYEDQPAPSEGARSPFVRWLVAHRVALIVSGVLICSLAAVAIIAWPLLMNTAAAQALAATATPDPAAPPYPVGLRLTGGWFFNLQKGRLTDGTWDPTSAEWLEGTELRRVVALPWNRQSAAVIQSLLPGDEMLLHMSNNDVQTYSVETIEQVTRSERDLLTGNDPSLLIVLVKPDSDLRWVVLCAPAQSQN